MSRLQQYAADLAGLWRRRAPAAVDAWAALRHHPMVLADIAARGGLWKSSHVPGDPHSTAYNEGRRSLALEIVELAGLPPDRLRALIEKDTTR